MEMGRKSGQMVQSMRVNTKMVKSMGKELCHLLMEACTEAVSATMKYQVLASINGQTEKHTKENG